MQQNGRDGRIHPAGDPADDPFMPDLLSQVLDRPFCERTHGPQGFAPADPEKEIFKDADALRGMSHFGMELDPVDLFPRMDHGRHGAVFRIGQDSEPLGYLIDTIPVTHPNHFLFVATEPVKKIPVIPDRDGSAAVLPVIGPGNSPSEHMGDILHAIAYAQDRNPQVKYGPVSHRSILVIDTRRSPREDNTPGIEVFNLIKADIKGMNFTIDLGLPHPPCDELSILGSEIQYQHLLFKDIFFHYSII